MNHKLSLPFLQKGLSLLSMAILIAGLAANAGPVPRAFAAHPDAGQKYVITIEALIDGKSQLIIKNNTVQWHHLDFAVPGRWGTINDPTVINGQQWFPAWPDIPDIYNYSCNCYSDVFAGLDPGIKLQGMTVELNVLQARGPVSIVEYPSEANDQALVIEFNDDDYDAADTYKIELVVSTAYLINVEALIDGRSQLVLWRNKAQWHHLDFAAPGRHEFANVPTIINGVNWFPVWPDMPDAENRDCNCSSNIFKHVKPGLHGSNPVFRLVVLQGRGTVSIVEYPSKANGQALVIEFDDDSYDGSMVYKIQVIFEPGRRH